MSTRLTLIQVLQHLQGQATEATLNLTYMSYNEAIIMRIITVVTIIYLPATFTSVSNLVLSHER